MNLRKGERRGRKGEKERRGREERKERREGEKRESDRVGGEGEREGSRKRGRRESREKRNCITLVLFHNAKLIPRPCLAPITAYSMVGTGNEAKTFCHM